MDNQGQKANSTSSIKNHDENSGFETINHNIKKQ